MRKHIVEVRLRLAVDANSIGQAVDQASRHIKVRSSATVHRAGDVQIVAWEPQGGSGTQTTGKGLT